MSTNMRRLRLVGLQPEDGGTNTSLENAKVIDEQGYKPALVCHEFDEDLGFYHTKVYYNKGKDTPFYYYLFTGLSSNYNGEGTRGFIEFLSTYSKCYNKTTYSKIVKELMEPNMKNIILLDEDYAELYHIHISQINLNALNNGQRSVVLKDNRPRIINKLLEGGK